MATAELFSRPNYARAKERDFWWIAHALIFGAIFFNAVLCLVNTHLTGITNQTVILSEIAIVSTTILVCHRSLNILYVFVLLGVVFYTLTLALIRANISPDTGVDVKIARDFLIPIVFFMLGQRTQDLKCADSIVGKAVFLILALAIFEYASLENFLKVFGIAQYYVARGTLEDSAWAYEVSGGLMASGIRPTDQGRTLLAFLGDHRVSSAFLEPVGLGNFGWIVVIWAIVRSRMEHKLYFWWIAAGLAFIVLSDSRFAAYFLIVGVFILFMTPAVGTLLVMAMPIAAMAGLLILYFSFPELPEDAYVGGFGGAVDRLLYSGRVLANFDILNWLGIRVSDLQTFDAGYGYIISNTGIVGLIAFFWLFVSLKGSNRYFYLFRNANVAYFAGLFCISASQMTIKTAALAWFLMGTLAVAQGAAGARSQANR